jgi:hypothetical protein
VGSRQALRTQVILSGDFYQLPPVPDREGPPTKFAFDADSWTAVIKRENMHALTRVFRQKEDRFVGILERMRRGMVKSEDAETLRMCQRTVRYDDGIEPVALYVQYPTRLEPADAAGIRPRSRSTGSTSSDSRRSTPRSRSSSRMISLE